MYGVLYAVSAEIFPAKDRGTGNGLTATASRVFGVMVRVSVRCGAASRECTSTGACHCAVREPRDGGAGVRCGRLDCLCGFPGLVVAVRTER
jgi:hypothetical protein